MPLMKTGTKPTKKQSSKDMDELKTWLKKQIDFNASAILCYVGIDDCERLMMKQWNKAYASVLKKMGEME